MYLIKVRVDRSLGHLQRKMQKMMDDMMNLRRPVLSACESGWTPEGDMYETERDLFLIVNLAGVKKEEIEVSFHENCLRIRGQRVQPVPTDNLVKYHKLEMGHGDFERVFNIPAVVEEDGMEAAYEDGLLTVRMAKRNRPRSVPVRVRF